MFCKIDSAIVTFLCACGGVVKLMLLTSGLTGVLAKCTCLALQSVPKVQLPNVSSVEMAPPCFLFTIGSK